MDSEMKDLLERILVGMEAGFADVYQRFALADQRMEAGFADVYQRMDTGFAEVYQRMDARFESFQAEMRDGFRSVDERLSSLERDVAALWAESRAHTSAIGGMSERIAELSERVSVLSRRQDSANAEVSQRLRVVIERIAALEHGHRSS